MRLNKEWVAAGFIDMQVNNFKIAKGRYKNIYTSTYIPKNGDATETVGTWHGSKNCYWFSETGSGMYRGRADKSVFYYHAKWCNDDTACGINFSHPTRAVVVVGSGV